MKKLIPLLIISLILGCKKKGKFQEITEDLSGFKVFVLGEDFLHVYNINDFNDVVTYKLNRKYAGLYKDDSIYLYGEDLRIIRPSGIKRFTRLKTGYKGLLFIKRKPILLFDNYLLNEVLDAFIPLRYGEKVIPDPSEDYLYVLDTACVRKIEVDSFKVMGEIRHKNLADIALSPFGLRLYCAHLDTFLVYDARSLRFLYSIVLDDNINKIELTGAGNKIYCVCGKKIFVIDRIMKRIKRVLKFSQKVIDFRLSDEGIIGIALTPSYVYFIDAGFDKIIKKLNLSEILSFDMSPKGTRCYFVRPDTLVEIRLPDFKISKKLYLPGVKGVCVKKYESVSSQIEVAKEAGEKFYVLQVVSTHSLSRARELKNLLLKAGYPAFISQSEGWYRVRIGLFTTKEDAEALCNGVEMLTGERPWVALAEVPRDIVPDVNTPDITGDGAPEFCVRANNTEIIIFTIRDKVFVRVHTIKKFEPTYIGEPTFEDINNDGRYEIVIPMVEEGMYSVIFYREGEFEEEIRVRE